MIAALVVLCVTTVCSLGFAAFVWVAAAERQEVCDADVDGQRMLLAEREASYHIEHLDLQKSYATMVEGHQRQIERLLTAALDRDGLTNLHRLEMATARNGSSRQQLLDRVMERQMDAQDDDLQFENVGFQ